MLNATLKVKSLENSNFKIYDLLNQEYTSPNCSGSKLGEVYTGVEGQTSTLMVSLVEPKKNALVSLVINSNTYNFFNFMDIYYTCFRKEKPAIKLKYIKANKNKLVTFGNTSLLRCINEENIYLDPDEKIVIQVSMKPKHIAPPGPIDFTITFKDDSAE